MTSRVCSKNKEKRPKGKIVFLKKIDQTEETESSVAGSRTRFICTCKKLLDHCTMHSDTPGDTHDLKK